MNKTHTIYSRTSITQTQVIWTSTNPNRLKEEQNTALHHLFGGKLLIYFLFWLIYIKYSFLNGSSKIFGEIRRTCYCYKWRKMIKRGRLNTIKELGNEWPAWLLWYCNAKKHIFCNCNKKNINGKKYVFSLQILDTIIKTIIKCRGKLPVLMRCFLHWLTTDSYYPKWMFGL